MGLDLKGRVLSMMFRRWRPVEIQDDGYSIVLPSPMDMPFLLRLALEGLRNVDTKNCSQILVVPDGWSEDNGAALREVVELSNDKRVELVNLSRRDYWLIHNMKPPGGAATHWMMVVNGTAKVRAPYAFLHDADAFFLEPDGLERQYRECRDREMFTLGVTARWDPFFQKLNFQIPGTWELMYSTQWARSRSPYLLKGRWVQTPDGWNEFDSMLYPQYLDHASGRVGVMKQPPEFVHFNGTIFTYRMFRASGGQPVVDELFRILLLSILEALIPSPDGKRMLPSVHVLAEGLDGNRAPVRYDTSRAAANYPAFREMIDAMCRAPIFSGERASQVVEMLEPFDSHFAAAAAQDAQTPIQPELRRHGLG